MRSILLGQLFELRYGKSLRKDRRIQGEVPVYGSNGTVDFHNESLVNKPTIVVGRKGSIGEVHFVSTPCWPIDTTYFVESRGKYDYDLEWLFRLLKTLRLQNLNRSAAIPGLNRDDVYRIEIPLPPLDDQMRIAHLLGKVEGLIARRKQHLQQLDDLLKSVFLEMFGNPVRNEKEWDIQPCEKVVLGISSGTSYGGEDRAFVSPDEVGVLKVSAVTKGIFDPSEFKVVNPAQIKKALRFVKRGDFLFSRANTVELVAACCVVPQDFPQLFLPDKLWVLTLNHEMVNPQFFNFLLKNDRYRDIVRSLASGGHDSMLNISMKKFMTLRIPCPLIDLQNQFAAIVEKVEGLKSRYQQSLADLESLYGALSQKAFKGELDLSRVALPVESTTEDTESTEEWDYRAGASHGKEAMPHGLGTSDKIEFSALDEYPMSTREGRERLLRGFFDAFLDELKGDDLLSFDAFWSEAHFKSVDYMAEDDEHFGPGEYDLLKSWVYEALEQGRLTQAYDDTNNRVQLKAVCR